MLQVNIDGKESRDSKSIYTYDITKLYNSANNISGYGVINADISDIVTATLAVTKPKEIVITTLDVISTLPSIDIATFYQVTNTSLGLAADDILPIGVYTLTFTVAGVFDSISFTNLKTIYIIVDGPIRCCIYNKIAKLAQEDCKCIGKTKQTNEDIKNSLYRMLSFLDSAKDAIQCGKQDYAQKIVECVDKLCKAGCGCGCH